MAETETTTWSGNGVPIESNLINPVPVNDSAINVNSPTCMVNGPSVTIGYTNPETTTWT